ncbi:MAG: zf-HC2 domain-containing protein [Aristaeellaceae bacterium]
MMKYNCDIVRDLMPLCADGTASEPARQMVVDHVLECRDCMQMYQEMRTEVPKDPPAARDAAPFRETARRLRRRRNKRRTLLVLAGILLGLALVLGGLYVLHCMTGVYSHVSDVGDYSFSLQRLPGGQILCTMTNLSGRAQQPFYAYDSDTHILSMYALHPLIAPAWATQKTTSVVSDLYWDDELGLMYRTWNTYGCTDSPVLEIRQGSLGQQQSGLYISLFVRGQDIPLASGEVVPADGYIRPDAESGSLMPFMTPTLMATVQPTLAPRQPDAEPLGETPQPTARTDDGSATAAGPAADSLPAQALQPGGAAGDAVPTDVSRDAAAP